MAERSSRRCHTCMWGFSGILRSCQALTSSPKLISHGAAMTRKHTEHPSRLAQINEECGNNGSELDLTGANARARNGGNLIQEDEHKTKHNIAEGQWCTEMDSELTDCLAKAHKRSSTNSRMARQLPLPHLSDADGLSDLLSEYFQRSLHRGKYDDQISMQRVQMSAKAVADQMFIESLIRKQGRNFRSNLFSNALHVWNSDKDLLSDQNSLLSRRRDRAYSSQTEETFKAEVDLCTKTSTVVQPRDDIVILKPGINYTKHSGNTACHCSPGLSDRTVSHARKTSFSFRGMKKRLKHTFGGTKREGTSDVCIRRGTDGRISLHSCKTNGKLWKKEKPNANKASDIACETSTVRKKLDFSGSGYGKKQEFDVIIEAKRHLSARLKKVKDVETVENENSFRTLRRVLASPEHDFWPCSPGRESQQCSCSAQMRFCPYNSSAGVNGCSSQTTNGRNRGGLNPSRPNPGVASCDDTKKTSLNQSTYRDVSATANEKYPGGSINEGIARTMEITETIKLHKDNENDSLSENELSTPTMDDPDLPSTPSSVCQLDMADANKFQEHQSPVSVLHPMFAEDADCPQSIAHETAQQLHLDFEECSLKSSPHGVSINRSSFIEEQDHQLSEFVHSVLQASCLNWDQLSETRSVTEELLRFHEVQFLPADCQLDPKLLLDLMNEVLLSIHKSHFCFPPRLASIKQTNMYVPLQELVLDKIMTIAEFHLLPRTEKRTLDDIVSKDVTNCGSWLDVRLDTEQITVDISDDFLEECILDMMLDSMA